jgi:hypothetical protein
MKFETKEIEGYKYVSAFFNYNTDKEILDSILAKAEVLNEKVNTHSSGGEVRSSEIRINKLAGGLLVEHAFLKLITNLAEKYTVPFEVLGSTFSQEGDLESMGFNQIDLSVLLKKKKLEMEVRSSYSYKTSFERLLGFPLKNDKGAFSLIGWYVSKNKPNEVKKDFYIFGIHYYKPSETIQKLKTSVAINIVAIASKETLEALGYDDNLKQEGALFRIINPINSISDVVTVLKKLIIGGI